jgi:predicted dehydrogenase
MQRRDFLRATAAAGLAASASTMAHGAGTKKYRAGLIGTGWYGMVDLRHFMDSGRGEVVALCDVDKKNLEEAAHEVAGRQGDKPALFHDFRDLLKPRNLDVVLIGTPDHWHALTAIAAMQSGADVYCEKPISHTYLEGKAMLHTARKLGRVVQINTQRRSTPHFIKAREFIKEGKLGHVGAVRAYTYYNMRAMTKVPDEQPPKSLDFDFWTGPAPMRPYNPLMHPRGWRNFMEYGNGILGDMGVHMLDAMRWILGVRYPKRISSTGGIYLSKGGTANTTDTQTVTYDYGDMLVTWEHRMYGRGDDPKNGWGVNFYGDKGTMELGIDAWDFYPWGGSGKHVHMEGVREGGEDPKYETPTRKPAGRAHMKNFLDCVASRARPVADIEEGHISTALCELGNIAQALGRSITWDADKEQVVGDDEANRHLRRKYREPWVYPTAE